MDDAPADFGDDLGEAFLARPSIITTIGGEWRGHFRDGGVQARRMANATIYDTLRLTENQHQAAERLHELWCDGGFERPTTGSYGGRGGGCSADDDTVTAADEYRAILRKMPFHLAVYVDTLMLGQHHPASLGGIRGALDWCVKEWRL